jgi:hypothetical protein
MTEWKPIKTGTWTPRQSVQFQPRTHPAELGMVLCPKGSRQIAEALVIMGHEAAMAPPLGRTVGLLCWSTVDGAAASETLVAAAALLPGMTYTQIATKLAADPEAMSAFDAVHRLDGDPAILAAILMPPPAGVLDREDPMRPALALVDALTKGLDALAREVAKLELKPHTAEMVRQHIEESRWRINGVREWIAPSPVEPETPEGETIP